ncbi:hemocyte protein-glutamine gamma-glutamyltransferase [Lepeophtheirus salmonis]|uniref:hemocyte protein-glutamine gamma-glutamyltransferase n=1 Tax=Lepeophtheirus salmonis TaxID=72036 RepID=UPI001AE768A1|nr:hemocyte protein-glutamine gamma-glutamyltransferase-like [Lepeophtheirus salmonis]
MDFNGWLERLREVEDEHVERDNYVRFGEAIDVKTVGIFNQENCKTHRTTNYELTKSRKTPVVRRGQIFFVALDFLGRSLDVRKDKIVLIFSFGKNPNHADGTKVTLTVNFHNQQLSQDKTKWDISQHRTAPKIIVLNVQIGSEAPVGAWKVEVETSFVDDKISPRRIKAADTPLYILFNPYSRDDQVYMQSEAKLEEYIQNPTGKIWKGDVKNISGRQWIYGQFDEIVLPAICYIMDTKGQISDSDRGDPVKVSRTISSVVNSEDNNGILRGKWFEPYDDGTSPWDWNSSAPIFEEYVRNNGEVKYGQSWVFSALTVTVCRALGIPCRSVTNYVSAHDANNNLTVERYFNEEGEELSPRDHPDVGYDKIWNFHVWNDVWMSRTDLPKGYGGWQAIDSTPQYSSNGLYQCGPASLLAIKRGEVTHDFDTRSIYSQVNADVFHFVLDSSCGKFIRSCIKKDEVGKKIVTQLPNYLNHEKDDDYEDISLQYKFYEGSQEERLSVFNAVRSTAGAKEYYNISENQYNDVLMKLDEMETIHFGSPYKGRVFLENTSNEQRTLNCLITSSSMYVNGIKANEISRAGGNFTLKPGQRETLALTVEPDSYINDLVEYCVVKIYSLIRVKETNQTWSDECDFVMKKPKLLIQTVGWLNYGQLAKFRISFRNPLHIPLTNCKLRMGAAGLFSELKTNVDTLAPHATLTHTMAVKLKRSGTGSVVATFSANEMVDLSGSAKIEIN